jgi:hypothetical protein
MCGERRTAGLSAYWVLIEPEKPVTDRAGSDWGTGMMGA